MRRFLVAFALTAATTSLVAVPARAGAPKLDQCFDVHYDANSPGTRALFARRKLQGGGPTWAAILRVAYASVPALRGIAYHLDDEADDVLVCTASVAAMTAARGEYERLNHDAKALEKTVARVPAAQLE
jgi:hypothetical protein